MLPLEGIGVVDLSQNIAGPLCTMLLGDLGADVVKIERPEGGDEARSHAAGRGTSPYFASLNRSKRSVCLDLKAPEGNAALAALLRRSHIFVNNLRPGALARLRFDDDRLRRDFPHLVTCHITGFGRAGPWGDAPAYDQIIQGFSGLMSLTGPAGVGGYRTNASVADFVTGLFAATSVLASLRAAERRRASNGRGYEGPGAKGPGYDGPGGGEPGNEDGEGDIIHISLLAGMLNVLGYQSATYLSTGEAPEATGNEHPYIAPYGAYATRDGLLNVCVGNDRLFSRLCRALDLPGLADDRRFGDNASRVRNREALNELLEPVLVSAPSARWVEALRREGIPCGPVHTLPEALSHPQVDALDLILRFEDGLGGHHIQLRPPFESTRLQGEGRRRPPLLGEHTREVLDELRSATTLGGDPGGP